MCEGNTDIPPGLRSLLYAVSIRVLIIMCSLSDHLPGLLKKGAWIK